MIATPLQPCRAMLALAAVLVPLAVHAGSTIVRDSSLGTGPATALPTIGSMSANGLSYARIPILEGYGSRVGGNLFHSFRVFDIGTGDGAVFLLDAPTSNIVSRVTGGQASRIAGLLSVDAGDTGSRPNVYLLNPAGVTFSSGAVIDVPAAFHVSSADVLTFPDGRFESDPARASTLSSAEPAAFGFLGARSASVSLTANAQLLGNTGGITIAAGDIALDGAAIATVNGDLRLAAVGAKQASIAVTGSMPTGLAGTVALSGNASALTYTGNDQPSGDVRISAGEVRLGDGLGMGETVIGSLSGFDSTGNAGSVGLDVTGALTLDRFAALISNTGGAGAGGAVEVRAGSVSVESADEFFGIYTYAFPSSTNQAGAISVAATGPVSLNRGGQVFSRSDGTGDTGAVSVSGSSVTIGGDGADSWIYTWHRDSANAGPIDLRASGAVTLLAGATVWSVAGDAGTSGTIRVKADTITLDGLPGRDASVSSTSTQASLGDTGSISLEASGLISMPGNAIVTTLATGAGDAGNVLLSAGSIELGGPAAGVIIATGTVEGSSGQAGDIDIASRGVLTMRNGTHIVTSTDAAGDAGSVRVRADSMSIEAGAAFTGINSDARGATTGDAGDISVVVAGRLAFISDGIISSNTMGTGHAGAIHVEAGSILMDGHNTGNVTGISSSALEGSSGNAGTVTVRAHGDLTLVDIGEIASATLGSGSAGSITVDAATIVLDNAQIAASATEHSSGQVGNMTVRASESITMRNFGFLNLQNAATRLDTAALQPGTLLVSAPIVQLDGSVISSSSFGNVAAGAVVVRASDRLTLRGQSAILTAADSANGGPIVVDGGKLISMTGSTITTSVQGQLGNGGDIDLVADVLLLESAMIRANTNARGGSGGDVRIAAGALVSSGSSLLVGGASRYTLEPEVFGFNVIQAAAPTGVSGTVALSNPVLDIAGALVGITVARIDTGGLGRNPCQAGGASTLVQSGRGSLPPSARGLLGPAARVSVTPGPVKPGCGKD